MFCDSVIIYSLNPSNAMHTLSKSKNPLYNFTGMNWLYIGLIQVKEEERTRFLSIFQNSNNMRSVNLFFAMLS